MELVKPIVDKPVVVLLHGMFGNASMWDSCKEYLSHQWHVITPQLPVFDLPSDETCVEGIGKHVKRLLDELGVKRAVIGGNSLGGHVALHLALGWPESVSGLMLAGSSGLFERGFERNIPHRPSRDWLRCKIQEVFYDKEHVTESLLNEVSETVTNRRRVIKVLRVARSAKRDNLRSVLHRIGCPVLLAWGANDNITPPSVAEEFKECLPHAELHFIPKCGHAPMQERPGEFNALVARFLQGHFSGTANLVPSLAHS